MSIWEPTAIEEGRCIHWCIGPLDLWVVGQHGEWWVARQYGDASRPSAAEFCEAPHGAEWERWALSTRDARVAVRPAMPNRPIVVRPASTIHIMPGNVALFFVSIPVWIEVLIHGVDRDAVTLCSYHTVRLSNSWFGTPADGEFCYALRTRARRLLSEVEPTAHRVVCPVSIRNEFTQQLLFERLCLRVDYLAVYEGASHLWTNEARLVYRGEDATSRISYASRAPDFETTGGQLAAAHAVAPKGLAGWAFGGLKAFTTFLETT